MSNSPLSFDAVCLDSSVITMLLSKQLQQPRAQKKHLELYVCKEVPTPADVLADIQSLRLWDTEQLSNKSFIM